MYTFEKYLKLYIFFMLIPKMTWILGFVHTPFRPST